MAQHTKGPWEWLGNASSNQVYLATTHSGRQHVMGFKRWGMRGAQPQFQPVGKGLVDASELLEFVVGDKSVRGMKQAKEDGSVYRYDISGIDCADARLIAAAPDLFDVALKAREMAKVMCGLTGCRGDDEWVWGFQKELEAAIAKATGEA